MRARSFMLAVILAGIWALGCLGGCAASLPELNSGVATDDEAIKVTSTLLASGSITVAQASQVQTATTSTEIVLDSWNADIKNGASTAALAQDAANTLAAIAQVTLQLESAQPAAAARIRRGLARFKPRAKASISPTEIIDLATILVEISPTVATTLETILDSAAVTQAQVDAAIAAKQTDAGVLAGQIGAPATGPG